MARKVLLVDDISGDVIDEGLGGGTIHFSFDERSFQIDLGAKNAEAFRKDMAKWIEAAEEIEAPPRRGRPAGAGGGRKRAPSGSGHSKETLAQIREWATANGHDVSPRGRIAAPILQAWEDSHST